MPRIYRRLCDHCGAYYEGKGKHFCTRKCWHEHEQGLTNTAKQFPVPSVPEYQEFWRLKGDWMVSSDWHVPFYDPQLADHQIKIAKKLGIRKHLIAGDFLDESKARSLLKNMPMVGAKEEDFDETLLIASDIINLLLEHFDEVRLICGNHDVYMLKIMQNSVKFETFWRMLKVPVEEFNKRFFVSVYPFCELNNKWHITHPKNYSQIPTAVARKLSYKYRRSVISAHGHHFGFAQDFSGRDICGDSGGMFNYRKMAYKWLTDTTHPQWSSGFWIIKNNFPYLFGDLITDWNFWENQVCVNSISEKTRRSLQTSAEESKAIPGVLSTC